MPNTLALFVHTGVKAAGIESVKLPFLPDSAGSAEAAKAKIDKAASDFENSDFLKNLRDRSEQNREKCVCQTQCLPLCLPRIASVVMCCYVLTSFMALRRCDACVSCRNKKELQDKYCYRQAEMGVGDVSQLSKLLDTHTASVPNIPYP